MQQKTLKKDFSKTKSFSYSSVKDLKQKVQQINYASRVKNRPSMKDSVSYSRVSLFDTQKQEFLSQRNNFSMIDLQYPFKKNQVQKFDYQNPEKFQSKNYYQKSPSTKFGSQTSSFFNVRNISNKKDIFWKNKNGEMKSVSRFDSMQVLSQNFLTSFKIVFNQLIETYFLHIYLKKKIRYLTFQIWNHILKSAGPTYIQKRQNINLHQIDIKVIFNALKNVFPNEFKPSQIQQAIKIYFPSKTHISYGDFQNLMNFEKDIMDFLVERSYQKKYGAISPSNLINTFLKTLIQYADFEKKLKMISKANSHELVTLLISLCRDQSIQILSFANFLDDSENYLPHGMRQTETKINNFFQSKLSKRCSKSQFLKWLQLQNTLLR